MGCFWTFDNLSYLSTTETVSFGVARATRLFARAWSVGSVLLALLGLEALRKVCVCVCVFVETTVGG